MTTDPDVPEVPQAPLDAAVPQAPVEAAAPPASADPMPPSAESAAPASSDADPAAHPPKPDLSPEATGARLATLFPALFVGPDGKGTWKAIKLRIHADIQARAPGEFSKRALGIFFSRYTTTTPYLKALAAEGATRFDLDGQPAGEIADEHRNAANEELARRQAIAAERREAYRKNAAAQREAARPRPAEGAATPAPRPARAPRAEPTNDTLHESRGAVGRRDTRMRPPEHRDRAPRGDRPPAPRADRHPAPRDARRPPHRDAPPPHRHADSRAPQRDAAPALPTDPAQRERALLLRAFESSPLSKANFCALKRISEAELDAALALARAEQRPA